MFSARLLLAALPILGLAASGQPLVTGPVVIFLGAPGSGKSTQAVAAAKHLKVPIVSAADLVKENAAELNKAKTPGITGIEPETDPLLNRFFEARLKRGDLAKGVVLDGYPNTKDHADFASKLVVSGVLPKPLILHLQIPDEIVRKRLGGKSRTLPPSDEQRLKDYHRETIALQTYFPNAEIIPIDGTKKKGAVSKKVIEALKAKYGK